MHKHLTTRLWLTGLGLAIVGGILLLIGGLAGGDNGFIVGGWIVAGAGGVVQLVAWVSAMIATARGAHWAWFAALLVLGLLGLEFFVMIAYFFAGPTDAKEAASPPLPA